MDDPPPTLERTISGRSIVYKMLPLLSTSIGRVRLWSGGPQRERVMMKIYLLFSGSSRADE